MFNQLYNKVWSIHPSAIDTVQHQLKQVSSGPVDDASRRGAPVSRSGSTAIVEMRGAMIKDAGIYSLFGFAGTRDTDRALKAAALDDEVEQVLWVIDSPGGSVDGLIELADTVKSVAAQKPVIVQVDGMLASAALYAAANATQIYAGKRDLVGSIGTRIMLYDFSKAFEKDGIKAIPVDTGDYKSAAAPGTEITEDQIADFQRIVDGYFDDFKSVLSEGRGLNENDFEKIADGRVFFANEEPIEYGLIDGIQTLEETISLISRPETNGRRISAEARLKLLSL